MNRTRIAIVGLALLATACTGGSPTTGTPTPGTSTDTAPTSSGTAAGDGKLTDVKPCELISSSEASQLNLTATPEARKAVGKDTCEWIDKNGGLTVVIDPTQSADVLNYSGDTKTPTKVGKYDGFRVEAAGNSKSLCDVVISVSESSHVQIVGNAGSTSTDTAKACELSTKSAELIAAKLP